MRLYPSTLGARRRALSRFVRRNIRLSCDEFIAWRYHAAANLALPVSQSRGFRLRDDRRGIVRVAMQITVAAIFLATVAAGTPACAEPIKIRIGWIVTRRQLEAPPCLQKRPASRFPTVLSHTPDHIHFQGSVAEATCSAVRRSRHRRLRLDLICHCRHECRAQGSARIIAERGCRTACPAGPGRSSAC